MAEMKITLSRQNIENILKVFITARYNLTEHDLKLGWDIIEPLSVYRYGERYIEPKPEVYKATIIARSMSKEEIDEDRNRPD
jgi:hypothetical protein